MDDQFRLTGVVGSAPAAEPPPFLLDGHREQLRQVQLQYDHADGNRILSPLWSLYIVPQAEEHLARVAAFAHSRELLVSTPRTSWRCLEGVLRSLDDRTHTRTVLSWDFAPYSFSFQTYVWSRRNGMANARNEWDPATGGGVIYHGPGSDGVSAPEFSVHIGSGLSEGWSIHT